MKDKTITINTENLSKEDWNLLDGIIKRAEEKPIWKPQKHEEYYYVTYIGGIDSSIWSDNEVDSFRWSVGNVFKTIQEAEFAVEKLKVTAELKRYAEMHNAEMDWKDDGCNKWYIGYDYIANEILPAYMIAFKCNNIYFSSGEIAENAIKKIGEERIKRYYLGVEE